MFLIGFFLITMVLSVVGYFALRQTQPSRETRQLAVRMNRPDLTGSQEILRDELKKKERWLSFGLGWLYRLDLMQKLEQNLWQAGIYRRVSDVLLLMLLLFGAGAVIGAAMWQDTLLAIGAGAGLSVLPVFYVRFKRSRRLSKFVIQLPFALDLMKSAMEAGHSLLRGLQVVVGEFEDPIATEFRSVIEQARLGLPLPRAMEEMLKRVPEEDLRLLIVAIRVQSEVGSSLAAIIGRLSEIVRTRQRLGAQVRALTAQARMSGWVVGALPIIILAAFSVIQPSYTTTLFHDPSGQRLLKVAAVLDLCAFLSIRKLLKVKF
jgi:tight adherence protein B